MDFEECFKNWSIKNGVYYPSQKELALYFWNACAERKDAEINSLCGDLNIERIRELIGYLISMASLHDIETAKKFADELEDLLPKCIDKTGGSE